MSHVFISYSRQQEEYAHKLAHHLTQRGFDVWIDDRIDYGEDWWNTIVDAIRSCVAFTVIMSPDSEQSVWVQREIGLALRWKKPVFPLLLAGENFPLFVWTQYVDIQNGELPPQDFIERLSEVIEPSSTPGQNVAERLPKPRTGTEVESKLTSRFKVNQQLVNRRLQAAMPKQTRIGSSTEVRVKIALPDSAGLKGELLDKVKSEELISSDDVSESTFPFEFPLNKPTGKSTSAKLCLEVTSKDYNVIARRGNSRVCKGDQVELELPLDRDSRTVVFELNPKEGQTARGRSRVIVSLAYRGKIVAETSISTDRVEVVNTTFVALWNLTALSPYAYGAIGASLEAVLQAPDIRRFDRRLSEIDSYQPPKVTPSLQDVPSHAAPSPTRKYSTRTATRFRPLIAIVSLFILLLFSGLIINSRINQPTLTPLPATPDGTSTIPSTSATGGELIVTNFNTCSSTKRNELGGEIGTAYSPPDVLQDTYPRESERGCVAELQYTLTNWAAFWLKLQNTDLRQYRILAFDIKADRAISGNIKVELKSGDQVSAARVSAITTQWRTINVDLSKLEGSLTSLAQMTELVFTFEAPSFGNSGIVYLDNIRFKKS